MKTAPNRVEAELRFAALALLIVLLGMILFAEKVGAQTANRKRTTITPKKEEPAKPVLPAPLPVLPPPLSAQALPYPREFIKRPFTLPEDRKDLTVQGSAVNLSTRNEAVEFPIYLLEVMYRKPLTSDFNLIFNPLPLGLQYQPKRTDTVLTGVSWIVGWQYQGNFGAFPQFTSFFRYFLSEKTAFEMQLQYATFIPFKKAPSIWRGSFRVGPLFQYSETLAISPRVYLWIDNVRLDEAFRPNRTPIENQQLTAESAQFQIPISLWVGWSFNKNFDLTTEYTLFGAGLSGDSYAHLLTLGLTTRF